MKFLLIHIVVVCIFLTLSAQNSAASYAPPIRQPLQQPIFVQPAATSKTLPNTGIPFTQTGMLMAFVSVGLLIKRVSILPY